jgi:hypothetical protein
MSSQSESHFSNLSQFIWLEPNARLCELDDGTLIFFKDGMVHRRFGPAVIYPDGTEEYWRCGRRHRDNGDAIEGNGVKLSFRNGKLISKYYWVEGEKIFDDKKSSYISYITRTYHALENASARELGYQSLTFMDEKETDTCKYYFKGIQHVEDSPAEIKKSGTKVYYMYGVKHRVGGPAVFDTMTKSEYWYQYGMLHREDGPATTIHNKVLKHRINYTWYKYGLNSRQDGPACITYHTVLDMNIYTAWYKDGNFHRSADEGQGDGPCTEHIGVHYDDLTLDGLNIKAWFNNGVFHRIGGPAVIYNDKGMRWTMNGRDYTEESYNRVINRVTKCMTVLKRPLKIRLSRCLYESNIPGVCKNISAIISDYVY